MFTPTQFDTVEQKEKFVGQFKKFVESDFDRAKFPKWFYQRLSNTFGMIAHYDQNGFYDTYFMSARGKVNFIESCGSYPCYGNPAFTYSDVEKHLIEWLSENNIRNKVLGVARQEREEGERTEYARLKAKYG